jgi:6-phosphogluconolactonase
MIRTRLLACLLGLLLLPATRAEEAAPKKYMVYIGTYTSPKKSQGIYRMELDLATGKLTEPVLAGKAVNPSFLAIGPTGKFLYAVGEIADFAAKGKKTGTGAVSAFAIDQKTGDLTLLNQQSSEGSGPCHVSLDKAGKYAFAANYGGGNDSIAVFAVDPKDGKLTHVENQGTGIKTPRNFAIDPSGKYCLVANQDAHSVLVFRVDPKTGKLSPTDVKVEIDQPVCVRFLAWPR